MRYSFDKGKNAENLLKHRLSLGEGEIVLSDPLGVTIEDDAAEGESRWVTVGTNEFGEVRLVVWTQRGEEIRIISLRKATPSERKTYEEGI